MLGKLYINSNSEPEILRATKTAAEEVGAGRLVADAASRNSLAKLVGAVEKALALVGHGDGGDGGDDKGVSGKSISTSLETEEGVEAGEETEKENVVDVIAIKKEPKQEHEISVSFDELSILQSESGSGSRMEDDGDGDTIMDM